MIMFHFDDTAVSNSGSGLVDTFDDNMSKIRNSMMSDKERTNVSTQETNLMGIRTQ